MSGLSPRLRGNRWAGAPRASPHRSIPAPTGKPPCSQSRRSREPVYPRAYGETAVPEPEAPLAPGLSPRLRGNQLPDILPGGRVRSIPAPTGKPSTLPRAPACGRVYPRAYGETPDRRPRLLLALGLSPRLRGNQHHGQDHGKPDRSIPAPTGKPYGLTVERWDAGGLSPRLRGNRMVSHHNTGTPRSIPRAYGETCAAIRYFGPSSGLSPRLRGNQSVVGATEKVSRSIPAPTGKPLLLR